MAEELERRGPGRPPRAQQEAQRRRRRGDEALAATKRLPIPPEVAARLKAEGREPRWVNDQSNRMHRFTVQDDYDPVDGVEPVPVGTDPAGQPILAHLLSKPKEFIEEDRARADKARTGVEKALASHSDAPDQAGQGNNPNPATAQRYVTSETKIRRGNQILE